MPKYLLPSKFAQECKDREDPRKVVCEYFSHPPNFSG